MGSRIKLTAMSAAAITCGILENTTLLHVEFRTSGASFDWISQIAAWSADVRDDLGPLGMDKGHNALVDCPLGRWLGAELAANRPVGIGQVMSKLSELTRATYVTPTTGKSEDELVELVLGHRFGIAAGPFPKGAE